MDPEIEGWMLANGGLASTVQLRALGVSLRSTNRWVAQRSLRRVGTGVLIVESIWGSAQPSERHRLRAEAVLLRAWPGSVALTHQSSLAIAHQPLFGVDRRTHVMRLDGTRHHSTRQMIYHQPVDPAWVIPCGQQFRVRSSLAALQVADAFGVESGLVAADAVAHSGVQCGEFAEALDAGRFARGTSRPGRVVDLVDGRIESAGESRCRWLFQVLGMPVAEPQVRLSLPSGREARVDFLFRGQRTVVEFDGLAKYQDRRHVIDEKLREDGLRRLGYQVVRIAWGDLSRPALIRSKLEAAFQLSRQTSTV